MHPVQYVFSTSGDHQCTGGISCVHQKEYVEYIGAIPGVPKEKVLCLINSRTKEFYSISGMLFVWDK